MVGIDHLRKRAQKEQTCLARIVYGKKHYDEEHIEEFYKPRYLRRVIDGKRIMAYPSGVPGGWSQDRKVHFIGHSQGAQTVRYL